MNTYLEPDECWAFFGCNSLEEYFAAYLVKGNFGEGVPLEVKEAFTTVEYLLAHAYYHWPKYDEGFNKALRILEMAVKLKAKQSSIEHKENAPIKQLIDKILFHEQHQWLKNELHRARNIRNRQMHPKSNSYMGGTCALTKNIKQIVCSINSLFYDESTFIAHDCIMGSLSGFFSELNRKPMVLKVGTIEYVAKKVLAYKVVNSTLIVALQPVLVNAKEMLASHSFPKPLVVTLWAWDANTENLLKGKDESKKQTTIGHTSISQNITVYNEFEAALKEVDKSDRELYEQDIMYEASWGIVEAEYRLWGM